VIAECKKASPSAGLIRSDFDPVVLASAYEGAGAAAISVVTEPDHFLGDPQWLPMVRHAVELPVLRKDFLVGQRQLFESAVLGADAVLLISRLLDRDLLEELLATASDLDLEVLLEVFADEDPAAAVASGADIIGVNARDLATFEMRLDRVEVLAVELPADRVRVAESGIHDAAVVARLHRAGYDAFLVGEHLVRAEDPAAALRDLLQGS
jgi:indole-3-glycerol phosphate synthase